MVGVAAEDGSGRIGFVLVIGAALGLVFWLDARARRPVLPAASVFLPTRYIVGLFAVFALTWLAYDHLVLDAFGRGKFGYLE